MMSELAERLANVRGKMSDAARQSGRTADELTLITVTKFHPASLVRELAALGERNVGENRHQEARAKAAELSDLGLTWHFVGQLQSKKARQMRRYAASVHSIDRASIIDALDTEDQPLECFVQVNLTDDPARGGVQPRELEALVERVLNVPSLRFRGLMAVAPLDTPARPAFERVRELSNRVQRVAPGGDAISMGMSHDFVDAILEGATHLRIGTAITGNRPEGD